MKKEDIISGIEELLAKESVKDFGAEFTKLTNEFNSLLREEDKVKKQRELAELKGEEIAELNNQEQVNYTLERELDDKIKSLIGDFKVRKNNEKEQEQEEWKRNLSIKKELIESLEKLISEEERIGPAIGKFKEIQKEWSSVGSIASDKYHDIQNKFKRAEEDFNYNIGIYKELKSHDLKRNQQIKSSLILDLKGLLNKQKISDIEKELKIIQQKWTETGPTDQLVWEALKSEYWGNINEVQNKIQDFYNQRKSEYNEHLKLKIELIEKVQSVMAQEVPTNHREWEAKTNKMLQIQEEWNKVGAAKREDDEQAKQLFRSNYNRFYADKQEFYSNLKARNEKLKESKIALIEKAKSFETSSDWNGTADELISLQKQWKNIESISRGEEQVLWESFRSSCDKFFDAKQSYFNKMDEANAENLILKQGVISKITAFSIDEDVEKSIHQLKSFSTEFNAIGHVPFKEKEPIYNAYKKALEFHFNKLNLEDSEKEKLLFENRLEVLKQSLDPAKAFEKEKISIRNNISTLNDEIIQSQNNLGFFSGKGVEKLKEQVEQNVNKLQLEINNLKLRLSLIPNN